MPHRVGGILRCDHRLRHAGEAREFVDHPADVVDLAHDRVGALFEDRPILRDELAVFAPQPFRRELDRRERILDLVGDAARHFPPCLHALHAQQMAHVLEEEEEAARADVLGQEAGAGEQHGDLAPVARQLQLPLDGGGRGAGRVGHAEAGRSRQGGTELRRELAHVGVGLAREHLVDAAPDRSGGRHAPPPAPPR